MTTLPDDLVERARHLREGAAEAVKQIPPGDVPVDQAVGFCAQASVMAQMATVDLLLVLVDELREGREQDRREARKDRREARRSGR